MTEVKTLLVVVLNGTASLSHPTATYPRYENFTDEDLSNVYATVSKLGHTVEWHAGRNVSSRQLIVIVPRNADNLIMLLDDIERAVDRGIKGL
jgi:hypothetical protein